MMADLSRSDAWALVEAHVQSESLRRHLRAVEASMRAYARRFGEDEELFGLTGLLHDLDYEEHPEEHPLRAAAWLRERGYPEAMVHAILAHNSARTGVAPETLLDRTLWACDEITGLIIAAALVRPSRSLDDLSASSVLKKFKDKAFAAGVDRDDVRRAADALGVDLAAHIETIIAALRPIGPELGLARLPQSSGT